MKKGLSVLLIAAALFGFYGGATSLNDILASKDYWEEVGEKSTADMNKLEDGLNQLKDNEKAYLDGQEELAEGEAKLADAEKQLADGRAELAQGEADYAAAPKKLADAEDLLADGRAKLNKLKTAIDGVNTILNGYNTQWKPGYTALKEARAKLYNGTKGDTKNSLLGLAVFLNSGADANDAYVAAVNDVAGDDEKQTAKDYKDFIKSTNEIAKDLPVIQVNVKQTADGASTLLAALNKQKSSNFAFAREVSAQKGNLLKYAAFITDDTQKKQFTDGVKTIAAAYENFDATVEKNYDDFIKSEAGQQMEEAMINAQMDAGWEAFFASDIGKALIKQYTDMGYTEEEAKTALKAKKDIEAQVRAGVKEKVDAGIKENVKEQVKAGYESNKDLTNGKNALLDAMGKIAAGLADVNEQVNGATSPIKTTLLPGLMQFNAAATDKDIDKLLSGQDDMANGIQQIASGVLDNSELKKGVRKSMGESAILLLRAYATKPNPANSKMADFAMFEKQMDKTPGLVPVLMKARQFLGKTRADGIKTYNAGLKEYKQGLADYAAAPAKLADGRKQLAEGEAAFADGQKQLADGKKKLGEYEDGEQQVRDGLATLMATEADPGLKSILERRNGDDKFDDANGHLMLDEGLEAVETGRGYQADSGDLITKEITNRAVGTAAGIGACALAVLAAVLSFLKKNKGAAVSAVLAAVAGCVGTVVGMGAGQYYSDIAGSTVGSMPFIAAGITAAIALVFAIVHFTAKPEAK